MIRWRSSTGGYTLVELMVAFAILVVISSILSYGIPFIKDRVHDVRRQGELSDLQRAIEVYHSDNDHYPTSRPSGTTVIYASENDAYTSSLGGVVVGPAFVPNFTNYYPQLPADPLPGASTVPGCQALGDSRTYIYFSNGYHYKLVSNCASETGDYSPNYRFYDPARPDWAWALSDDINLTSSLGW